MCVKKNTFLKNTTKKKHKTHKYRLNQNSKLSKKVWNHYKTRFNPEKSSLYWLGVQFLTFLKIRLKLAILLKPDLKATSEMLISFSTNQRAA